MQVRKSPYLSLSFGLLLAAGLSACGDAEGPTANAPRERAAMSQVAQPGFSFLSPIVKDGSSVGTFNPTLLPVLEVCNVATNQCTRVLTTGDVNTGIAVQGDPATHYQTQWRFTGGATSYASGTYRFSVLLNASAGAPVLGSTDVIYDAATTSVSYPDGQTISQNGTTPVKFFIALGQGLLCSTRESDTDFGQPCLEVVVGPDGGTFTVDTKLAGAYFPPGALSQYVTLIIERYEPPTMAGEPMNEYTCVPVNYPQYEGCYVFRTEPDLPQFNTEVVVGICPELSALDLESQLELWKWDEVDQNTAMMLPRRNVDFLECPGYDGVEGTTFTAQASWSRRLLQPLAKLLLPSPLMAAKISPFGGGLNDFSRIGWVRPLSLQITAGDNQEAYVGDPVPVDPQVRVIATGEKVIGTVGVPGITIDFTPSTGGTAAPATTTTGPDGYASTVWTLGTAGPSTLVATAQKPSNTFPNLPGPWGTVTFSANGVTPPPPPPPATYRVVFTSPLESGKLTRNDVNVPGVVVRVEACSTVSGACWQARRIVANNSYHYQLRIPADAPVEGTYNFTVYEGSTVLGAFVGAVAKDNQTKLPRGVDFTFQLGSTIPVKFYLVAR